MSAPLLTGRRRVKQRLAGLVFLAVIAGLVALTVALYTKAFSPSMIVFVEADRVGSQLSKGGDVKARGVLVGTIREVSSNGARARLKLSLDPDEARGLPSDLRVQLLPKTLFGEKFVALVVDDDSTARPLREGDVIAQDQSEAARETSTALDNLLPLLQALRPQDVSTTLNAVSTALRGRGDQVGQNLVNVENYLAQLNPDLPTLGRDFAGVADLADTLTDATPDILRVLDNLSASSQDLVQTQSALNTFLKVTASSSGEIGTFLDDNEDRFIRLAADSLPSLQVYARYSPEFPCLTKGLTEQSRRAQLAFGGLQPGLHITVEQIIDNGGYRPGDEPLYAEDGGPTCFGLPPNAPVVPFPINIEVTDGYCDDQEKQPGVQTTCEGRESEPPAGRLLADPARLLAQRDRDRVVVGAVAGPMLGVAGDDVPDLASLLFGPLARGTTVGLSSDRP